jgi:hypothetical protein
VWRQLELDLEHGGQRDDEHRADDVVHAIEHDHEHDDRGQAQTEAETKAEDQA